MDLVLIAIIPPEPAYSELRELMEKYSGMLESTKALKIPPHITLFPPFLTKHYDELVKDLHTSLRELHPFTVEFSQLSYFRPTTLFIDTHCEYIQIVHDKVADTAAVHIEHRFRKPIVKMSKRKKELIARYGNTKVKEYYRPHLTLAKIDVNKSKFAELTAKLPEIPIISTQVKAIQVLRHNGRRWEIDKDIPLIATF